MTKYIERKRTIKEIIKSKITKGVAVTIPSGEIGRAAMLTSGKLEWRLLLEMVSSQYKGIWEKRGGAERKKGRARHRRWSMGGFWGWGVTRVGAVHSRKGVEGVRIKIR